MASESQYQGSQAYAHNVPSDESISPNSGRVGFSKTLVDLRGVTVSIGLQLKLSYTPGTKGSFGAPKNWGLEIPFTIPHKSLTSQGKDFVVDPNWKDQDGWSSGLKYVNNHGMLFEHVFPAQSLPSKRPGEYEWFFRAIDGSTEYFDVYGKLLEHQDLYGNSIYFSYVDDMAGPLTAKVDYIEDSWGQKVLFEHDMDAGMSVRNPDGGKIQIDFGSQGVDSIKDAMGYTTSFKYDFLAGQNVIDTITFPTGLQSKFEYTMLSALDKSGKRYSIPACALHTHQDLAGNKLRESRYEYGLENGYANFTGSSIGCCMLSSRDSLMESRDQSYEYDVTITRLDNNGGILQMSRIFYNYLHLSVKEDHFNVNEKGKVLPSHRTINYYEIDPDHHAWSAAYNHPTRVEQSHYSQGDFKILRTVDSTYDAYGCPLKTTEWMLDKGMKKLTSVKSITSTYKQTSWGGEMLESETFTDHSNSHEKHITYELTSDQRNIAKSTVTYRDDGAAKWQPWKTKSYLYDERGRVKAETVAWSEGANFPANSVKEYTYKKEHTFDSTTGICTERITDPVGNVGSIGHAMRIQGGPMILKVSPAGSHETLRYDLSGRLIETTDALGSTTKTSFTLGPTENFVQSVTETGYITRTSFDALGRVVDIRDSGTNRSSKVTRILSQSEYDTLSRIVRSTNELGLIATREYDGLNRVIKSTDIHENVITYEYNDAELTVEVHVNGYLRGKTFTDGLGRQTKSIAHGDSTDPFSTYKLVSENDYDAFGKVTSSRQFQETLDGSSSILLKKVDFVYDVEGKAYKITSSGFPSELPGDADSVTRDIIFDIFGNAVTYKKTVSYADGRHFVCNGPLSTFDAGNRLVQFRNQLGHTESNKFDADGRIVEMTRYDGTKFSFKYDKVGHMVSSTSPKGTKLYEYLPNGRLTSIQSIKGGGPTIKTMRHIYASDGSLCETRYPNGQVHLYFLDEFSRVFQERDAAGRYTRNTFDSHGRLASRSTHKIQIVYKFGTVNNTKSRLIGSSVSGPQPYNRSIVYDGFDRPIRTTDRDREGKIILDSLYRYDSRGRLLQHELSSMKTPDAPEVNQTEQFQYDGLGQLILHSKQYPRNLAPPLIKRFKYDGNFNVIQKDTNNATESFTYNVLDQRQDPGFSYDTNGRLMHDASGRSYVYDSGDKLLNVSSPGSDSETITTSYAYNPDESIASLSKAAESSEFFYSGGAVKCSLDKTGDKSTWSSYLVEPKGLVAVESEGEEASVFLESRNSVTMTLSNNGTTTHNYHAYGEVDPSEKRPRFGWQQELGDSSNGLTYLRSRYYQSSNMAFITMDSYRGQENRYAYCNGDPINATDGTGHDPSAAVTGAIVGTAVTLISGGTLGLFGMNLCGFSFLEVGVGSAIVSGALGSVAGDATTCAMNSESFSASRAGEDLLIGAVGGAVGAGAGGAATTVAMRMAYSAELHKYLITAIGTATSALVGSGGGSFASAGTAAVLHNQPLFSSETAFAALIGFCAGLGGALISGGVRMGFCKNQIPVELTTAELDDILLAEQPGGFRDKMVFPLSHPDEHGRDFTGADQSIHQTQLNGPKHAVVIAHGDSKYIYATVKYRGEEMYRPINATLLAKSIKAFFNSEVFQLTASRLPVGKSAWSGAVKLISCKGGISNGQKLADALGKTVHASYEDVTVQGEHVYHPYNPRI